MKDYTINQGKHSARCLHLGLNLFRKRVSRHVVFTESCRYYLPPPDDKDINKLFGLSRGYHRHNSARVGWRYNAAKDSIDLYAYCYVNGERGFYEDKVESLFIGRAKIGAMCKIDIEILSGSYQFYLNDSLPVVVKHSGGLNIGYMLYPYFGGTLPAPNDIVIRMRRGGLLVLFPWTFF